MIDPRVFDDIAKRLNGLLPESAQELRDDLERNVKSTLTAAFERMDLVTREEFEVQTAVLERTRAQLKQLEARIEQLEQQHAEHQPTLALDAANTEPNDPA